MRYWGHGSLLVLLDADADTEAHYLEATRPAVPQRLGPRARLPRGLDPGLHTHGTLWGYTGAAAQEKGLCRPPGHRWRAVQPDEVLRLNVIITPVGRAGDKGW